MATQTQMEYHQFAGTHQLCIANIPSNTTRFPLRVSRASTPQAKDKGPMVLCVWHSSVWFLGISGVCSCEFAQLRKIVELNIRNPGGFWWACRDGATCFGATLHSGEASVLVSLIWIRMELNEYATPKIDYSQADSSRCLSPSYHVEALPVQFFLVLDISTIERPRPLEWTLHLSDHVGSMNKWLQLIVGWPPRCG